MIYLYVFLKIGEIHTNLGLQMVSATKTKNTFAGWNQFPHLLPQGDSFSLGTCPIWSSPLPKTHTLQGSNQSNPFIPF